MTDFVLNRAVFGLPALNHTGLTALALSSLLLASACTPLPAFGPSPYHIQQPSQPAAASAPPPAPVKAAPTLTPPKLSAPVPTYTVVVNDVPVKDLLFSIARDTQYNIDLFPGISGRVTLNAVNEPLPSILDRIARQADLRYETHGKTISVMPDTPYPKTYRVNYVNVSRNTTSSVGVAAQISSTGSTTGQTGGSTSGGGNSSSTTVSSQTNNDFWNVLADNLRSLLAGTRAIKQSGEEKAARLQAEKDARAERVSQTEAASKAGGGAATLFTAAFGNLPADSKNDVAINPMTGTVSVLGTARQHEVVQQYLDSVSQTSQRQVMIEATIVEVQLKDQFRAGVNWNELVQGMTGWSINTGGALTNLANTLAPFYSISYTSTPQSNFKATIDLLESYGNTKVLSSPKLMALNNQTALLKVVDNLVYFTIEVQQAPISATTGFPTTLPVYTSTPNTIPVGIVMSVTPQIGDNGQVSLTVRPTISRVVGYKEDPNPALKQGTNNIRNLVPEIQVREMESLLQVRSGQTVILGGLIQDNTSNARDGLPVLSRPDGWGALFGQQERKNSQSELVIFLRPVVVSEPSLETSELRQFQNLLPSARSAQ